MTLKWVLERSGPLSDAPRGPHACFDLLAEDGTIGGPGSAAKFATREEAVSRRDTMTLPEEWAVLEYYER